MEPTVRDASPGTARVAGPVRRPLPPPLPLWPPPPPPLYIHAYVTCCGRVVVDGGTGKRRTSSVQAATTVATEVAVAMGAAAANAMSVAAAATTDLPHPALGQRGRLSAAATAADQLRSPPPLARMPANAALHRRTLDRHRRCCHNCQQSPSNRDGPSKGDGRQPAKGDAGATPQVPAANTTDTAIGEGDAALGVPRGRREGKRVADLRLRGRTGEGQIGVKRQPRP